MIRIGVGGGGGGGHCAPLPTFLKTKNAGKSNGNLGQKQWEIRENAMGNSGKSNNFCPKYSAAAFRVFSLLLPEFSHCFCPNFPLLLPEVPIGNSGKSNRNIWAKAMRKLRKRWDIFEAKIMELLGNFTNCHIIFKIYFLDQIKILKDLASSARIFSARNSRYTWKHCILDSGGSAMLLCYCEQV